MTAPEISLGDNGQKPASSWSPPWAVIAVLCLAFLLLQFDEKGFSGWVRLAVIWTTTLGNCLLAMATGYWVTRLRKSRTGPIVSILIGAVCLIACGWWLIGSVRDTRRALDPDHWLEIRAEYAHLPFDVAPSQTFYTLNLDPQGADGLHSMQAPSTQQVLWPEGRRPGEDLYWIGWLCTMRNRGMHALSDVTFDVPVSYTYGSEREPREWTVHHVSIPALGSNQDLKLLLGSVRENVYVQVYKPRVVLARVGEEAYKRTLRTFWLPFDEFWDGRDYLLLTGPEKQTSQLSY